MMTEWIKAVVLSLSLLSMGALQSGCTTMADAQADKGHGQVKVYHASYDASWDAALAALNDVHNVWHNGYSDSGTPVGQHFKIISADKTKGLILAHGVRTSWSWGENVAIYIEPVAPDSTRVEIINKRSLKTNVTAPHWENDLFVSLDRHLPSAISN
jgi:hypothetical protein